MLLQHFIIRTLTLGYRFPDLANLSELAIILKSYIPIITKRSVRTKMSNLLILYFVLIQKQPIAAEVPIDRPIDVILLERVIRSSLFQDNRIFYVLRIRYSRSLWHAQHVSNQVTK